MFSSKSHKRWLYFEDIDKGGRIPWARFFYLLFIDEILNFWKAFQYQLVHLHWLLMWFEACLTLKVSKEFVEIFIFS